MELGPFSYAMVCFFILILAPQHWDYLERRWQRSKAVTNVARLGARLEARLAPLVARLEIAPRRRKNWAERSRRLLRECGALGVALAIVFDVLVQNPAVPEAMRLRTPDLARDVVDYPRILQGWLMFAPDAPRTDSTVTVDARTIDGRHIDPYTLASSSDFTGPLESIPRHLGNDQYFTNFSHYLPTPRFAPYRHIFQKWVLDTHVRTGRPEDRIVSFEVHQLTDESPPPGELEPTKLRRIEVMRYPERGQDAVASR
jgi:hypothetical protein